MNILIVSYGYHPFVGGSETQTRLVAHGLSKNHSVEVAAALFKSRNVPDRLYELHDSLLLPSSMGYMDGGIPVHSLAPTLADRARMLPIAVRASPILGRYAAHRRVRGYRSYRRVYVPRLRKLMRGKDVVHCVADDYLGWAAEEAARAEGVPFVLTPYVHPGQHGEDSENVAFYRRADIVFALIETGREHLIELGVSPNRIRLSGVVPLLPEKTNLEAFRTRHGLGRKPVVLFVGRMMKYKGTLALLEAAASVWAVEPDVQFVFVGPEGDDDVLAWIRNCGDERIRYLGSVSEQDKGDALAACDLFCMPSVAEILPAVYLEAWSYRKPVVGGMAHGLRELIEGNGGGIVVEQDPEMMAARLLELLRDEPLRRNMGARGHALVTSRFSEAALVRTFEQAYEDAARGCVRRAA